MFFPVILFLASIWTAIHGVMVCDTIGGVACDFPFKRTADGPEFKSCQPARQGRTWCATSKIAATGVYDTWGYCNPTTCMVVPSIEEAREKIQNNETCFQCIEAAAIGPPPNAESLLCLPPCVFFVNKFLCHFTLLKTGTRECLEPCGFQPVLKSLSLAANPPCVQVSLAFQAGTTLKSFVTFTPSRCGNHCAANFPTQCTAWNWNSPKVPTDKNLCTCLSGQDLQTATAIDVFSGFGPASTPGQCPPKSA